MSRPDRPARGVALPARPPTAAARRAALKAHFIAELEVGGSLNVCSWDCIQRATAGLCGIRPKKVQLEHLQWAYPMLGPSTDEFSTGRFKYEYELDGDDALQYAGGNINRVTVGMGGYAYLRAHTSSGVTTGSSTTTSGTSTPQPWRTASTASPTSFSSRRISRTTGCTHSRASPSNTSKCCKRGSRRRSVRFPKVSSAPDARYSTC